MRTTIEMRDDHRARLLEIAGRRGMKGFSGIVAEAIEAWLKSEVAREVEIGEALSVKGSLRGKAGEGLAAEVARLRGNWR